jgi:Domain of unknown function (DUF4136)
MKKLRRRIPLALVCIVTSAVAQKIDVDYDHTADFSKFKTYGWISSERPASGLWNQRIVDGIDAQLQAKGLKKVDSNADPLVVSNSGVKQHTPRRRLRLWIWSLVVVAGSSPLHLSDLHGERRNVGRRHAPRLRQGNGLRADSRETLSDKSREDMALQEMFKNFPPRSKG